MDSGIFDMFTEHIINERLDTFILNNEEYRQSQKDIGIVTKEVNDHGFSDDEQKLIDRLICAYTAEGFRVCVTFLKEIGIIKTD